MADPAGALFDDAPGTDEGRRLTTAAPDEWLYAVPAHDLAATVERCIAEGWRFVTLVATDERPQDQGFAVEVALARPGAGPILRLRAALPEGEPQYPSVGRHVPAALWDERENHDLFGIIPAGHPDLRRLVLHDAFPDGYHPLRHDAPATVPDGHAAVAYRPFVAHGEGVYELPVGPIHAGVIEPGHFRFSAMGESVLYLDARLFFTHRGIEKLVEGRTIEAALPIVERSCGVCTVAHATAFSLAVERGAGAAPAAASVSPVSEVAAGAAPGSALRAAFEPPPRAQVLRAVLAELERVYNHVGDLGNICAGIGFNVGASQLGWLKEQALRLNEGVTGHRYLMGVVAPGGLAFDVDADALAALPAHLAALETEVSAVLAIVAGSDAVMARFAGAGLLPRETAEALGAVGVAARGSGIVTDLRADRPTDAYRTLMASVPITTAADGDVAARFDVRARELTASFALLRELLDAVPSGPVRAALPAIPAGATALGWAEGPRGASWLWLRVGSAGRVDRLHLRSASFANWPSVAASAAGNLVPDFPLINKSFELCYACTDR